MNELKPCPFCGGPAEGQSGGRFDKCRYGCSCANWNCVGHSNSLRHTHPQDAIDEWNCRTLNAAPGADGDALICTWYGEEEAGNYETSCGHRFLILDGSAAGNDMKFCCYCGGKLTDAAMAAERQG